MIYNSIIETIGNTPIVKLNTIAKGIPGTVLAKVEYFNPGNSTKDRMALKMIEDAKGDTEKIEEITPLENNNATTTPEMSTTTEETSTSTVKN